VHCTRSSNAGRSRARSRVYAPDSPRAAALEESGCGTCNKPAKLPLLLFGLHAAGRRTTAGARLEAAPSPQLYTDDTGASVTLAAPAARIVSLARGATELLFAAGAGSKIVATVQAADEPAAAKILRIGDANKLDYPRLRAAKPDVVVVWRDLTNPLVLESLAKLKFTVYTGEHQRVRRFRRDRTSFGRARGHV
jgi:ABC-type Fe3+-hydroxamate transport system substrate-binding protein